MSDQDNASLDAQLYPGLLYRSLIDVASLILREVEHNSRIQEPSIPAWILIQCIEFKISTNYEADHINGTLTWEITGVNKGRLAYLMAQHGLLKRG